MKADWLLKDKVKRKINFEFLNTPDFLDEGTSRKIDEDRLVNQIRSINPQMTVMVICYSQYLELKSILEKHGLFAEMRMNRDLSIVSNGQIWQNAHARQEIKEIIGKLGGHLPNGQR